MVSREEQIRFLQGSMNPSYRDPYFSRVFGVGIEIVSGMTMVIGAVEESIIGVLGSGFTYYMGYCMSNYVGEDALVKRERLERVLGVTEKE